MKRERNHSEQVQARSARAGAGCLLGACSDDYGLRCHSGELAANARDPDAVACFGGDPDADKRATRLSAGVTAGAGLVIGRCALLQQIREAGIGAGYLFAQRQSVRPKVAPSIIKVGLDTEQVVSRFEDEPTVTVLLPDLSIARVLDSVATVCRLSPGAGRLAHSDHQREVMADPQPCRNDPIGCVSDHNGDPV